MAGFEPQGDILFESDDYIVRHVRTGMSDICFVTFYSFTDDPRLDRPAFGENFLQQNHIDAIHFINKTNVWYLYDDMAQALEIVAGALKQYDRRFSYGSSMGGYASIRFAESLGVDAAIAISPQYAISPKIGPDDKRWRELARAVPGLSRETPHSSQTVRPIVFYDPHDFDREHFIRIRQSYPLTIGAPLPYAGHPAGAFLNETGLLGPTIIDIVRNRFDASQLHRAARRRRARSGQYFLTLARRLGPHHWRTKLALAQRAVELHDDAAYRTFFAFLLEKSGDAEGAENQLRAAMKRLPDHPAPLAALAAFLVRRRRYDEAVPFAKRLFEIDSARLANFRLLAAALAGAGEQKDLAVALRRRNPLKSVRTIWMLVARFEAMKGESHNRRPSLRSAALLARPFELEEAYSYWDEWNASKKALRWRSMLARMRWWNRRAT